MLRAKIHGRTVENSALDINNREMGSESEANDERGSLLKTRTTEGYQSTDEYSRQVPGRERMFIRTNPLGEKVYVILFVLLLYFTMNHWTRQILYYMCNFSEQPSPSSSGFKYMNIDLAFGQTDYVLLATVAFTVCFTVATLIAGGMVYSFDRSLVINTASALWSLLTLCHGLTGNYISVFILRSLVGTSQGFLNPAVYTMLSDLFPAEFIATANGIYSGGIYLGGALASLSIYISAKYGWRNTFYLVGSLGLVMSCLGYLVLPSESDVQATKRSHRTSNTAPSRNNSIRDDTGHGTLESLPSINRSISQILRDFLNNLITILAIQEIQLLLLASTFRFIAGYIIIVWKAVFMFERFPTSSYLFAGSNAAIVGIGGFVSSVCGGWLSDRIVSYVAFGRNDKILARYHCILPMITSLLAIPCWYGFIYSSTPELALLCLLGEYLIAESWFGPTLSAMLLFVPTNSRGLSQALFTVVAALGNFGPLFISYLVSGRGMSLDFAYFSSVSVAYFCAGVIFGMLALRRT